MRARAALLDEIERHPARFMLRELMRLEASTGATPARDAAAACRRRRASRAFLGCDADGLVFVDNATRGHLRRAALAARSRAGDEILVPDHAYGGVARAAAFLARERGASVTTFALPFPRAVARGDGRRARRGDHAADARRDARPRDVGDGARAAARRDGRGVPCARRRGTRRRRARARRDRRRHRRARRRLVRGEPAQVGVRAARRAACCGPRRERRRGLHPAVISWGVDERRLARGVRLDRHARSDAVARGAGRHRLHGASGSASTRCARYNHALAWRGATAARRTLGHGRSRRPSR